MGLNYMMGLNNLMGSLGLKAS